MSSLHRTFNQDLVVLPWKKKDYSFEQKAVQGLNIFSYVLTATLNISVFVCMKFRECKTFANSQLFNLANC